MLFRGIIEVALMPDTVKHAVEEGFRRIQYFSKKILTGNYTRILVKSKHKSLNDLSID